jgi:anti-sigma factor ChrR (cupin superfamily)
MITEQQEEQAIRCALGELDPGEERDFSEQVRANSELRAFLHSLQGTIERLALTTPQAAPPADLKVKLLGRLGAETSATMPRSAVPLPELAAGLRFLEHNDVGWKPLPIAGAFIKLLSFQADRGYAVLLGKLDPGVRYPAHRNAGPEDFYLLSGDLHVSGRALRVGDFHHADAGSLHEENYSVEGCTLLAVLTTDDPLVQLAMQ